MAPTALPPVGTEQGATSSAPEAAAPNALHEAHAPTPSEHLLFDRLLSEYGVDPDKHRLSSVTWKPDRGGEKPTGRATLLIHGKDPNDTVEIDVKVTVAMVEKNATDPVSRFLVETEILSINGDGQPRRGPSAIAFRDNLKFIPEDRLDAWTAQFLKLHPRQDKDDRYLGYVYMGSGAVITPSSRYATFAFGGGIKDAPVGFGLRFGVGTQKGPGSEAAAAGSPPPSESQRPIARVEGEVARSLITVDSPNTVSVNAVAIARGGVEVTRLADHPLQEGYAVGGAGLVFFVHVPVLPFSLGLGPEVTATTPLWGMSTDKTSVQLGATLQISTGWPIYSPKKTAP